MKYFRFLSVGILFTLGSVTTVCYSCGEGSSCGSDHKKVISLDISTLTLAIGENYMLTATNVTDKTVTWRSSDKSKATVSGGKVTAISTGTATITVQTGNETATCTVTVYNPLKDNGIIINGIKWATRNVGKPGTFAAKPEDAGMFYQWNSKTGWSSIDPMKNSNNETMWVFPWNGGYSESGVGQWDKTNNPCPAGWRMPTQQELQDLYNTDSKWTTVNGVNGRIFGSGSNVLFLAASGYRYFDVGRISYVNTRGYYWSSTVNDTFSYFLDFDNKNVVSNFGTNRAFGFSCRCVAK